ncbi:lysozyme [Anabrus simplex]|uniref:lysozyme n=1 Tax=Anabrus simplex TaxID=316456 RepID=UPI0035A35E60
MKNVVGVSILLVVLVALDAEAKVFSRCGLFHALKKHSINSNLPDWVCLVEAESGRNTAAKGGPNRDGSYDFGLFQINSRYWCGLNGKGGDCNIKCSDLLNDDISDDAKCALKIYRRHGFSAWYGWKNKCNGKPLPDLSKC